MGVRRALHRYGDGGAVPQGYAGLDASIPEAGFYRMRLRSGAVPCGVRIWHGPPHDPDTGEEMDRSWRWQAEANGDPVDIDDVWPPRRGFSSIDQAEYRLLCRRAEWAREHAPDSAVADPRRRSDPLTAPIAF